MLFKSSLLGYDDARTLCILDGSLLVEAPSWVRLDVRVARETGHDGQGQPDHHEFDGEFLNRRAGLPLPVGIPDALRDEFFMDQGAVGIGFGQFM